MKILEMARFVKNELMIDVRQVLENISIDERDFGVGNYRFIHEDIIDQTQQDELGSDLYVLGCFNSGFLAGVLGLDRDVIASMQQADAYEALGKLIVSMEKLANLQADYSAADGYGHHFNPYDGGEEYIGNYYIFRTNQRGHK